MPFEWHQTPWTDPLQQAKGQQETSMVSLRRYKDELKQTMKKSNIDSKM